MEIKIDDLKNKIFQGNVLGVLKNFPDNSIDCSVSSPPYWNLRNYNTAKWEGGDSNCDHSAAKIKTRFDYSFNSFQDNNKGSDVPIYKNQCPTCGAKKMDSIWDADPNCDHDWGFEEVKDPNDRDGYCGELQKHNKGTFPDNGITIVQGFCKKCPAWMGPLGNEPNFNLFIKHLCDIYDEIYRILKPTGTCWVNLGDTFMSDGQSKAHTKMKSRPKFKDRNKDHDKNFNLKIKDKSLPKKCLLQIPNRFAIEMCNRGWILRQEIIWQKPSTMPSSVTDRFTVDFEKIFFFVKDAKKYYFKQQFEPSSEKSKKRYKYDFFKGKNLTGGYSPNGSKHTSGKKDYSEVRNMRAVWQVNPSRFSESHFATYPKELIRPCIDAGCPPDGLVFDPFMGAATTAIEAYYQHKNYVGTEINPEYIKIAENRILKFKQKNRRQVKSLF